MACTQAGLLLPAMPAVPSSSQYPDQDPDVDVDRVFGAGDHPLPVAHLYDVLMGGAAGSGGRGGAFPSFLAPGQGNGGGGRSGAGGGDDELAAVHLEFEHYVCDLLQHL